MEETPCKEQRVVGMEKNGRGQEGNRELVIAGKGGSDALGDSKVMKEEEEAKMEEEEEEMIVKGFAVEGESSLDAGKCTWKC